MFTSRLFFSIATATDWNMQRSVRTRYNMNFACLHFSSPPFPERRNYATHLTMNNFQSETHYLDKYSSIICNWILKRIIAFVSAYILWRIPNCILFGFILYAYKSIEWHIYALFNTNEWLLLILSFNLDSECFIKSFLSLIIAYFSLLSHWNCLKRSHKLISWQQSIWIFESHFFFFFFRDHRTF